MQDAITFLHDLTWDDLPATVRTRALACLGDLCAVGSAGAATRLSAIIRDHAVAMMPGNLPLPWDGRGVSAAGLALATGMTIDALDGHDGFNPAKGHAGCGVLAAALAFALDTGQTDGRAFLTDLVIGYELACRLAQSLHDSVTDYHTSGAWVAVAAACIGARRLGLSRAQTEHAAGIAEYHGPRSQMMRCIDNPTMLKDGSGWGAMAGVSAAFLARSGFTGAPALTMSGPHWQDLGRRWLILEQYFKPYPVCRWAHPPVEAVLHLRQAHGLSAADVALIRIETFHEATRLATQHPTSTDEAQYSTSFPTAVALVRGRLDATDLGDAALQDPDILRLSAATEMIEHADANAAFPNRRLARATLTLSDGREITSVWHEPRWDATAPPDAADLALKFTALAEPALGPARATALKQAIARLEADGLPALTRALAPPLSLE